MNPFVRRNPAARHVHALLAAVALWAACTVPPPALLPLEPWGDVAHPYGDAIEKQAWEALGPRPAAFRGKYEAPHSSPHEPVRLGEFYALAPAERELRAGDAESVYQQALKYRVFAARDSLPLLLDALRIDPAHVAAYEQAASVLLQQQETARAHALAVQGLRLAPDSARLWGALAEAYMRRDDPERAGSALRRALDLDAGAVPGGVQTLAVLEANAGHWGAAESLLALVPQQTSGPLNLYLAGRKALAAGDPQGARDAFAEASRHAGAQAAVFIELGNCEYTLGHLQPAAAAFERALQLAPAEPAALTGQAIVQRALGHPEAAVAAFASVAARRPHDGAAQFNLAGASLDAAQRAPRGTPADSLFAVAETAFSACIDANYRSADALERRAHLRLRRGAPADAAVDAQRLLDIPTHQFAGRVLLARAALAQKKPAEAVRVLTPAADPPTGAEALLLLGKAYTQLGRHADAAGALQRAHDLDPGDWTTAMSWGIALSESGDLANAERILRGLVDQRPTDPAALQNLAAVLQRRGRRAEAQRLLDRIGTSPGR